MITNVFLFAFGIWFLAELWKHFRAKRHANKLAEEVNRIVNSGGTEAEIEAKVEALWESIDK